MSTLFVVDSSARRTAVKVTPATLLQSVLVQACQAKKLDPALYTLKTAANKPVDLSQQFRLSGLSAGAKLQLVQASRSAGVVNIAIQLPDNESGRLSDKFPSITSLWLILRKFEDGVAGSGKKLNLTQRGVQPEGASAGTLLYETPSVSAENRKYEGFEELQKTLGELGYNGGNVLLKISFRRTEQPLEEAMKEIGGFFTATKEEGAMEGVVSPQAEVPKEAEVDGDGGVPMSEDDIPAPNPSSEPEPQPSSSQTDSPQQQQSDENTPPPPSSSTTNRISVYRPPSNGTPAAALAPDDPSAFEPTIDHARLHQATLGTRGQNQRLKSDKELDEIEATRQQHLATVQNVRVRVQYPDEHIIETNFAASATSAELYETVRSTLRGPSETFELRWFGPKGRLESLPDSGTKRLVRDLGFRGGVKVTLVPAADASDEAKKNLMLKEEHMSQAQELKVELAEQRDEGEAAHKEAMAKPEGKDGGKGKGRANGGGDVEAKMKKFLGFGGKKR
ncbi:hypothetical protein LTR56_015531 [Elasticomyces elasticus]|nr:hypothetical protein LTR56_015531 [Elasticomyces elasticus]KAK3648320.1 hypothetical protein LTR22_013452 [Elasticomyces elasticus]KAK4916310.1 hypothetical protein LTR49_015683 [Elasticomyces elasticus]KAK5764930.1 hypothetical protein LTS12_004957 [Elasticomyces elasticus]